MEQENSNTMKFLEVVTHPQILASAKKEIDLNDLRATYGDNFNTLIITDTDTTSDIEVYLDGTKTAFVTSNNGVFSFDWETSIIYNFLSIENKNAAAAIAANKIKISVGRTGKG